MSPMEAAFRAGHEAGEEAGFDLGRDTSPELTQNQAWSVFAESVDPYTVLVPLVMTTHMLDNSGVWGLRMTEAERRELWGFWVAASQESSIEAVSEARACPFCHNPKPIVEGNFGFGLVHPDPDNAANHTGWYVWCLEDGCPIEGISIDGETRAEAVARWNGLGPEVAS